MTREVERLLKDCVTRTGRIDGTDWEQVCPNCRRVEHNPTALLAHRQLKAHYKECAGC